MGLKQIASALELRRVHVEWVGTAVTVDWFA